MIDAVNGMNGNDDRNPEAAAQGISQRAAKVMDMIRDKNLEGALKVVNNVISDMLDHGLLSIEMPSADLTPNKVSIESMALIQSCLKAATSDNDPSLKNKVVAALGSMPADSSLNDLAVKLKEVLERSGINPQNNTSFVARTDQPSRTDAGNKLIV